MKEVQEILKFYAVEVFQKIPSGNSWLYTSKIAFLSSWRICNKNNCQECVVGRPGAKHHGKFPVQLSHEVC